MRHNYYPDRVPPSCRSLRTCIWERPTPITTHHGNPRSEHSVKTRSHCVTCVVKVFKYHESIFLALQRRKKTAIWDISRDIFWFWPILRRYDKPITLVTASPFRYRNRDHYRIFYSMLPSNSAHNRWFVGAASTCSLCTHTNNSSMFAHKSSMLMFLFCKFDESFNQVNL